MCSIQVRVDCNDLLIMIYYYYCFFSFFLAFSVNLVIIIDIIYATLNMLMMMMMMMMMMIVYIWRNIAFLELYSYLFLVSSAQTVLNTRRCFLFSPSYFVMQLLLAVHPY